MQEIKYPYFKKDRILKIDMLTNLRDFPRDVVDILHSELSDGIISGLSPHVEKNTITFSKGIVKHKGQMYVLSHPVTVSYEAFESEMMLKLCFYEELKDNDFRTQYVEIELDSQLNLGENQLELGRFKLKKGAYLRSDYQDLKDFVTEYNTINIVNVLYSGYGEPTVSSQIVKYFAGEMLQARIQDSVDISFCFQCLNSSRIEKRVIEAYLGYKSEEARKQLSNKEIHASLVKILASLKRDERGKRHGRAYESKIIMD